MVDYQQTIVFDIGSEVCKVGISGEENPRDAFLSIIGLYKNDSGEKNYLIGEDALLNEDFLKLKYPTKYGLDYENLEFLYDYCFKACLGDNSIESPVLLTEKPDCPRIDREKITEIMFEKFDIPALCLKVQSVLSLFSTGRTSGLVLDSGACVTFSVPIYEGYTMPYGTLKLVFGGNDITNCFGRMLTSKSIKINENRSIYDIVNIMKEKLCYTALNYNHELKKPESSFEIDYELPDGSNVKVGNERFTVMESLFRPEILGIENVSVQKLVNLSINKCSSDLRNDFYSNIHLNGGSTLFPGFSQRLRKEIEILDSTAKHIHITVPNNGIYSTWLGGSLFSSLPSFIDICMKKDEYNEYGPSFTQIKFF